MKMFFMLLMFFMSTLVAAQEPLLSVFGSTKVESSVCCVESVKVGAIAEIRFGNSVIVAPELIFTDVPTAGFSLKLGTAFDGVSHVFAGIGTQQAEYNTQIDVKGVNKATTATADMTTFFLQYEYKNWFGRLTRAYGDFNVTGSRVVTNKHSSKVFVAHRTDAVDETWLWIGYNF